MVSMDPTRLQWQRRRSWSARPLSRAGAACEPGEVTQSALDDAIANSSATSNAVDFLSPSDPPTQGEMQAVIDKVNELITALRR